MTVNTNAAAAAVAIKEDVGIAENSLKNVTSMIKAGKPADAIEEIQKQTAANGRIQSQKDAMNLFNTAAEKGSTK